jgi:hypothetical protein
LRLIAASLTLALVLAGEARAGTSYLVQGLFCNTREQIAGALRSIGEGLSVTQAVALANMENVVCVWADRIGYMVTAPELAQRIVQDGAWFRVYEARLVGIRVGGNLRPVDPPVPIYFLPSERLPTSIVSEDS